MGVKWTDKNKIKVTIFISVMVSFQLCIDVNEGFEVISKMCMDGYSTKLGEDTNTCKDSFKCAVWVLIMYEL